MNITAHLLKARTVEPEKQPLLCSARSIRVRGDVTAVEEVMQAVFSMGALRGYMT
jgi:hypothetical protein